MIRISYINSNNTQLVNDYDLEKISSFLTKRQSGVMFTNINTKAEFSYSGGLLQPGMACIQATRTGSTPINNQKIAIIVQSDAVENLPVVVGNKIYIEIDNSLLQDQTSIIDTPPSTAYALGLNIATIKSTPSYPAHPNYIRLREVTAGPTLVDVRVPLRIDGDLVDMSNMTQDIVTTGDIEGDTATFNNLELPGGDIQDQLDDIIADVGVVSGEEVEGVFGENVSIGDLINSDNIPTEIEATQGNITQNIIPGFVNNAGGTVNNVIQFTVLRDCYLEYGIVAGSITSGSIRDQTNTTVLATSTTVSGGRMLFSPYYLQAGTTYFLRADQAGQGYNLGGPIAPGSYVQINGTFFQNFSGIGISDYDTVGVTFGRQTSNTRVSIPIYGSGVAGSSFEIIARKIGAPINPVSIRIETDNSGSPSGSLFGANGISAIASGSISNNYTKETANLIGPVIIPKGQLCHIVLSMGPDIIDPNNYYQLSIISASFSKRKNKTFNGTTRSTIQSSETLDLPPSGPGVILAGPTTYGFRITTGIKQTRLKSVGIINTCVASSVILRNTSGIILATSPVVGFVANFDYPLDPFTNYRIESASTGSSTGSYLFNTTVGGNLFSIVFHSQNGIDTSGATYMIDSISVDEDFDSISYVKSSFVQDTLLIKNRSLKSYLGITTKAYNQGETGKIKANGFVKRTGIVTGLPYYIGPTPGSITSNTGNGLVGYGFDTGYIQLTKTPGYLFPGSMDIMRMTGSYTYLTLTKVFEYRAKTDGIFGVEFVLTIPVGSGNGQVYVDNKQIGLLRSTAGTYIDYVFLKKGMRLQLFGTATAGATLSGISIKTLFNNTYLE